MILLKSIKTILIIFICIIAEGSFFLGIGQSAESEPSYKAYEWHNHDEEVFNIADRKITTLRDLNNAFVEIVDHADDTVVTVFTERVLKGGIFNQLPFFRGPFQGFMQDFFNNSRSRNQQEQEYHQKGFGSGVIVSADGYILTNNHVVESADTIYVKLLDKRTIPAKVIGTDPKTDIAVLKIEEKGLPSISFGDSDKLRVGEWVLAIGSPISANLDNTVTRGIVSAVGRSNVGIADYEDFIQTDAAINPGNSGGALINLDGRLIGINTAIASQSGGFQGIGFAVPINMARNVMDALIKYGVVTRGWLGVYMQDIDKEMAKAMELNVGKGTLVGDVTKNSPAEKAGIEVGDIILELNKEKAESATQLHNTIALMAPGTEIELKILRDSKEEIKRIKIGKLQVDTVAPETQQKLQDLFGFSIEAFSPTMAEKYNLDKSLKGVVISEIDITAVGARAGLQEGDLIFKINRKSVDNIEEFNNFVTDIKEGDSILLQVIRQNQSFFVAFSI